MNEMALPQHLRILTVTAHSHDITYTLGTSAHHIERGDSVTVVSLTDGVTTHDEELANEMRKPEDRRRTEVLERPRSEQARRKQEEMKRVCGLFGIDDVRVLGFADNPITVTQETHRTMAEIFYEVRPHIVISHAPFNYPYRNHSSVFNHDHLTTGQAVGQAIRTIAMPDPERKHTPHNVAQVYYLGVEFGWSDIDLFVDISDQIANRIKAEALYETQGHSMEFAHKRIEAFAGYHGWFGATGYAEPFLRAGFQTSDYLTVTDNDLRTSRESSEETLGRIGQCASGLGGSNGLDASR